MNPLLKEIRRNPLLGLLAFLPVVFAAAKLKPEAHTVLFVLSVLAIVPLAALLSHTAALKQESGTRLDLDQVEFCEMRHRMGGDIAYLPSIGPCWDTELPSFWRPSFGRSKGARNDRPECAEL
jgi:hypothetical protein